MNPQNPPQQPPATPSSPAAADPRQQAVEQIKNSTNVLLTVSDNPTVDQLTAVIGMTLLLNKLGKHATAVFSGQIPSAIDFLQPEKTLEKTTDSLRDFIIALDKSKADKLRYKVEDKFVKIFITPYRTSLSDKDLEFSQGDYNVDVVLALGVKKREELDKTIIEHGRILHDATVISINNEPGADIGAINWVQPSASGLSEMIVGLVEDLKTEQQPKLVDEQIATCFLTGIVAQTDRFSNAKTSPQTMSLAAKLMNAGANQQLIATKLEAPAPIPKEPEKVNKPKPPKPPTPPSAQPPAGPPKPTPPRPAPRIDSSPKKEPEKPKESQDGALTVPHDGITGDGVSYDGEPEENIAKIHIDDEGILKRIAEEEANRQANADKATAAQQPAGNTSSASLNLPEVKQPPQDQPEANLQNEQASSPEDKVEKTLSDIEQAVGSPHLREVDARPSDTNTLPPNLIGPDKGLPPDNTAGSPNPAPPPPVPPPLTIAPPRSYGPGNLSGGNTGVPL